MYKNNALELGIGLGSVKFCPMMTDFPDFLNIVLDFFCDFCKINTFYYI